MVSPAFPGMFFAFAGMVLLIFASVGPPAWQTVPFLTSVANGVTTTWGTFGYCISGSGCSTRSVGYNLVVGGANNITLDNQYVLRNLTTALILHPVAGGVAFLALVFGFIGVCAASRFATIMMALFASLAALASLVIFVIDMVLWNLVRNQIRGAGFTADLGIANWFTVGATVALFLSMCTSFCGAFGRFASGRAAGEKY